MAAAQMCAEVSPLASGEDALPAQSDGRPRRADVTVSYDLGVDRYEQLWSPVIVPAAVALLPQMALREDAVVLDVGGGTGALAPAIRSAAPRAWVVAVDASIGMLRFAHSMRSLPAVRADAMSLPVAANTVDAVVLAFVLFHLADPRVALEEALRVLGPGSRVGTVTWASERAEGAQKVWDEALAAAGAPPLPPRRVDAGLDSVESMDRLLRAAGFTPIRVWPEPLCRQWDAESFFALASGAGTSRQRLAGLDQAARSSLLMRLRESVDQLAPEEFWWEGEVICAVGAKEPG